MENLAIEIRNVHKIFETGTNQIIALKDIDLQVKSGAFVSLIGPSGCGKTSLIRIVGDLEQASSGYVRVNGKTPTKARLARESGMVFQNPALLGWRTVEENIALPGEIFKDLQVLQRAKEMVQTVGLGGFEQAYPRELSGGMKSRVSIARALTFRPSVLLMDEPFSALDEMTRERMQFELLRVWQEYKPAVIFITHSISEAILLSDRVVVMSIRPGQIIENLVVDFPRPRVSDLRAHKQFVEMEVHLRRVLEGES